MGKNELIQSGIECVGNVPWGTHICLLCQNKKEMVEMVIPYLREGLINNEYCLFLASDLLDGKEAGELLAKYIEGFDEYFQKGQIEILDYRDFYVRDTGFNAQAQIAAWLRKLEEGKKKGFKGVRTAGSRDWLSNDLWKNFKDYEKELNGMTGKNRLVSLCVYFPEKCSVPQIIDIVRNHRFVIVRRDSEWEMVEIGEHKLIDAVLRKNELMYEAIFETTGAATVIIEEDKTLSLVNNEFEKMSGYSKGEIEGKKKWEEFVGSKDDLKKMKEFHRLRRIKPIGIPKEYEFRFVDRRGNFRDVHISIDMIPGTKKSVCSLLDITKIKRAEMELEDLNKKLLKANRKFKQLALKDQHTGLYNHRYLSEIIEAEFFRAKRYIQPLSVIMLDIDYFKSINDVYGHQFGDQVLIQLARFLKKMVRPYDIIIRSGGEEFVIVSPSTDKTKALSLAQRILYAINVSSFGNKKHTVKLKMSIAVASYPDDKIINGIDLIGIVELILNKVKEYGGNRVYCYEDIKNKKSSPRGEIKRADLKRLKDRMEKINKKANQNSIEAIFAFAKTIELKDHYTGEHVERTVYYATEIAKGLGLSREEVERITQAAMLHDLGKIGISEKILLKKSKLNKEEFREIKKHPLIGVDIIRPIQFLHSIIPFILYHHERWDGKGYPLGLKGEEIPVGARIVAIADVYQALISDRPYRKAYSKKEAGEIIKEGSGTQFDPKIVETFLKIVGKEEMKEVRKKKKRG